MESRDENKAQLLINRIIQGDTLTVLKTIPDEFVDITITSPPYWGLRDYGIIGQIGLEPTLEEYIDKLLAITIHLKRILKPTGVMFWNHGDCYGGSRGTGSDVQEHWQKGKQTSATPGRGLGIPKCLSLQNYRLILRMIDEQGWILRNTIQWHKPNSMPSSVKDRFANSYEPVFMLVKRQKYWFDLDAVRIPHTVSGLERMKYPVADFRGSKKDSENPTWCTTKNNPKRRLLNKDPRGNDKGGPGSFAVFKSHNPCFTNPAGKNPGDLWTIPTQPFPEAHFATFPEKLIEPMIKSSCPELICKKCGKARMRITEPDKEYEKFLGKSWHDNDPKKAVSKGQRKDDTKGHRTTAQYQTLGWTDCGCKAGWQAGIVLDPFMGSGTVAIVAKKLGRRWFGIDLNPEYCEMARKRILNTQGRLL